MIHSSEVHLNDVLSLFLDIVACTDVKVAIYYVGKTNRRCISR